MNEHKMLKEIIELIGYTSNLFKYDKDYTYDTLPYFGRYGEEFITRDDHGMLIEADVREIIFTTDFMDKYKAYYYSEFGRKDGIMNTDHITPGLMNNLDNPTLYLYNLLNLGTKK